MPQADGLIAGDSITGIAFDGSQTDVGSSATTPKDATITRGSKDVTYCYVITYLPATLSVSSAAVVINAELVNALP